VEYKPKWKGKRGLLNKNLATHRLAAICHDLEHGLELELIQTRMIQKQKPLLRLEVGNSAVCLWGFANCASLCLLGMTRNIPHFWTFSLALGVWSASYGPVCHDLCDDRQAKTSYKSQQSSLLGLYARNTTRA